MIRLGILGSTRGTLLDPLVHAISHKKLAASIELVVSHKIDALILSRANEKGLPTKHLDLTNKTRNEIDHELTQILKSHAIDLIVLMGYMRILSADFIKHWQHKIINIHPSLLPAFAGKMDLDVHRAVIASGVKETGCTVHYVTEDVDAGPIILHKKCEVLMSDTPESLKARVQNLEGEALISALQLFARDMMFAGEMKARRLG